MLFEDALKALREGKKIKKSWWKKEYLIIENKYFKPQIFMILENGAFSEWRPTQEAILDYDWEVLK